MYIHIGQPAFTQWCQILLDNHPVIDVIDANEEDGYITVYTRGADGHYVEDGIALARERRYGAVTITLVTCAPLAMKQAYALARHGLLSPEIVGEYENLTP